MRLKNYLLLSLVFITTACSDALLTRIKEKPFNVTSQGLFCAQPPDVNNRYIKFLFVIDKSGSNNSTDPNNAKRADNIEKFWMRHMNEPRIKWGYIKFNGNAAESYIGVGGGAGGTDVTPGFSDKQEDMRNAIARQRGDPDADATPYKAALALARRAIYEDLRRFPQEDSSYQVFFMSDGEPTDYSSGDQAVPDVEDIMNLSPGRVNLSTAYYNAGTNNQNAINGLQKMAQAGQGKFVNLNETPDFDFDNLVAGGIVVEPWAIKNFMVYNVNSAICLDNYWGADSDGDGLCDKDETILTSQRKGNYDPQNRFSYGDGYSDYFHYISSLKEGAELPGCSDRTDEDGDLLTVCEESYMINNRPTGTTRTSADKLNPDTDGDGFLDGIEYFTLHVKGTPLDNQNVFKTPVGSPIQVGEAIIRHRNPNFYDPKIPESQIYDTKLTFMGYNDTGQACYTFSQNNLPLYSTLPVQDNKVLNSNFTHGAGGNVVLVYYIQTLERDPNSPGVYMSSYQTLTAGSDAGLEVNNRVFKSYKVPEVK